MSDRVLWRKIQRVDMMAMTGEAAPARTGGGAKHIALGRNSDQFPIHEFLRVNGCGNTAITIEPIPGLVEERQMEFACQPERRKGEWRIARQHHERYPLWTVDYGFPESVDSYDQDDPPVIFILRISNEYHARFCMLSSLAGVSTILDAAVRDSGKNSGIEEFQPEMGALFSQSISPPEEDKRIAMGIELTPEGKKTQQEEPEWPGPPSTTSSVVTRYIRDSKYGRELKGLYEYKCMFCEVMIRRPHDTPYVETCHIKPLNQKGPDAKNNLLILCPNHHVELDFGTVTIDPNTMTLLHIDSTNPLNGKRIQMRHMVDKSCLEFHFGHWKKKKLMGY